MDATACGHAVLAILVSALLTLDVQVNRAGYHLVGAACYVLVDHRGPLAVMTHARHQVALGRYAPD